MAAVASDSILVILILESYRCSEKDSWSPPPSSPNMGEARPVGQAEQVSPQFGGLGGASAPESFSDDL